MSEFIKLPAPTFDDTLKVSEAIVKRRSFRKYDGHALDLQVLSNLCYFSAGVTDADHAFCANPTACNCHEIDLYVVTATECSRYVPSEHALSVVEKGDFRAEMALQPFAQEASVQFVYVMNAKSFEKFPEVPDRARHQEKYSHTDAAIMAMNTCLYATSAGLHSVMRGMFDPAVVSKRLGLNPEDAVILTVSVG